MYNAVYSSILSLICIGACASTTPPTKTPPAKAPVATEIKVEEPVTKKPSFVLHVAKDESQLEEEIGKYLEASGLHVQYRKQDDDLILHLGYSDGFTIRIDTWFSTDDKTERLVAIRLLTSMKVSEQDLPLVYRQINAHHVEYWAGTFFVDSDSEIRGQWSINIPAADLPGALVDDAMGRLASSWLELRASIAKAKVMRSMAPGNSDVSP